MEQTPYWMWTKRKSNTTSIQQQQQRQQIQAGGSAKAAMSYNNDSSWEEQAFAEDAIGAFGGGGCVWPPRSYSCSFCRREFRSAQALGGHMNVHRRDRARLKQSPPTHHHQSQLDHNINQNHHLGFDQYHHYHHLQQPNPNHPILPSSWASRVCDNHDEQEVSKRSPIFSSPTTWANFVVGRSSDNKTSDDPKPQGCNKAKCVRTDLSVSLNLVLHQTHDPTMSSEDDEEAMRRCNKKRRRNSIDASSSSFPFFLKPTHQAHDHDEADDDEHSPKTTSEDLDLELRLGRSP